MLKRESVVAYIFSFITSCSLKVVSFFCVMIVLTLKREITIAYISLMFVICCLLLFRCAKERGCSYVYLSFSFFVLDKCCGLFLFRCNIKLHQKGFNPILLIWKNFRRGVLISWAILKNKTGIHTKCDMAGIYYSCPISMFPKVISISIFIGFLRLISYTSDCERCGPPG